jgi:hypothetical protein
LQQITQSNSEVQSHLAPDQSGTTTPFEQRVGEVLVQMGFISGQELEDTSQQAARDGGGFLSSLMELNSGIQMALTTLLNLQLGIPVFGMRAADIQLEALRLMPEELALEYKALPVRLEGHGAIRIATLFPHDFALSSTLSKLLGRPVRFALALRSNMEEVIKDAYARLKLREGQNEENSNWRSILRALSQSDEALAGPTGGIAGPTWGIKDALPRIASSEPLHPQVQEDRGIRLYAVGKITEEQLDRQLVLIKTVPETVHHLLLGLDTL